MEELKVYIDAEELIKELNATKLSKDGNKFKEAFNTGIDVAIGIVERYQNIEGGEQLPIEINVICIGDLRYRFDGKLIASWDFEYKDDILRIDFKDGSFVEFNRKHIVVVEFNKGVIT